jgi:hypothetical protein
MVKLSNGNMMLRNKISFIIFSYGYITLIIVKEIKQYQEKWLQHIQRIDTNRIPNKHYNINQKGEGT